MSSTVWMQLLIEVIVLAGACGTTYAAIRADLARLNEMASNAQQAAREAHRRIDGLLEGRR